MAESEVKQHNENKTSPKMFYFLLSSHPFLRKTAAILKIQDGGQGGLEKNANIDFQIHKILSFPKMYSFHFLQKIPTKKT